MAGRGHCFCLKSVASFPFAEEYVAKPVCAICFLSLLPEVSCMKPAPESGSGGGGAPDSTEMER